MKSKNKKEQVKPYVYIREEIPDLVTFDGLTPKEIVYNSFLYAYKNTKGVLLRIADIERKKQNEITKKTDNLIKEIILASYKPLYVEGKNVVMLYINPSCEDVLMKAIKSDGLRDYKIVIKSFGNKSIKRIFHKLPYLIFVYRRLGSSEYKQ